LEKRSSTLEVVVKEITTYYSGKKVFLTGHTGFKGSWLLLWLQSIGAIVKGYALAPEEGSLFNKVNGDELCESVIADIRDAKRLLAEIQSFQPDYIFHLAAQPLVRLSYVLPQETFETNVNGTMHVLEAVRKLPNFCTVVIVTTDKVYENQEKDYAYREEDKLGGYDPYSASKAATEMLVNSYRNSFFNPEKFTEHKKAIATARAGNVIGGGDYAKDRIIPDIVAALENGKPIEVRNPKAVRPWQHVLEPLWGYLQLGIALTKDPKTYSSSFNFGPDIQDMLIVEQLVAEAIRIWGSGHFVIKHDTNAVHEAGLLQLDNSKSKKQLSVYPVYSSQKAVEQTIAWYKNAKTTGYKVFTLNQINKYTSAINGV
jgi:CDP-glucose 4,6-dehydratase